MDNKNIRYLDPKIFGLSPRIKLEQINANTIGIIKPRKSRIIVKDGQKIIVEANKIRQKKSQIQIYLFTNAPICSKTKAMFEREKIIIKSINSL